MRASQPDGSEAVKGHSGPHPEQPGVPPGLSTVWDRAGLWGLSPHTAQGSPVTTPLSARSWGAHPCCCGPTASPVPTPCHSSAPPGQQQGKPFPAKDGGTAGRELFLQPQQDGHHTHGGGRDAKSPSSSQEHLNPEVRVIDPSFHAPGLQLTLPFVSHMSHVSHGLCHSSAAFAAFPERGGFVHRSKAQGLGTTAGEREGRAAGVPCSWQHLSPPACPLISSVPQMLSPAHRCQCHGMRRSFHGDAVQQVGVPQPLLGKYPQ